MTPTLTGETEPLYSIKDQYVSRGFKEAEEVKVPSWLKNLGPIDPEFKDSAVQTSIGPMVGVTQGMSFDGIGESFVGPNGTYSVESVPPDTDMAEALPRSFRSTIVPRRVQQDYRRSSGRTF